MAFERDDFFKEKDDSYPEVRLWCCVLIQFLKDCQEDYIMHISSLNGRRNITKKRIDLNLKLAKSEWIETICGFCSVSHSVFISLVKRINRGEFIEEITKHNYKTK